MTPTTEGTVVVLNANCGSKGHTVRATNYAILFRREGFTVEEIDVVAADPGPRAALLRFLYRLALAHFPFAWRFFYNHWEHVPGLRAVHSRGIAWRFRRAREILESKQPAVI